MDFNSAISEIQLTETGLSARLEKPEHLDYKPGQFFMAYAPILSEITALPLFIQKDEGSSLLSVSGIPSSMAGRDDAIHARTIGQRVHPACVAKQDRHGLLSRFRRILAALAGYGAFLGLRSGVLP